MYKINKSFYYPLFDNLYLELNVMNFPHTTFDISIKIVNTSDIKEYFQKIENTNDVLKIVNQIDDIKNFLTNFDKNKIEDIHKLKKFFNSPYDRIVIRKKLEQRETLINENKINSSN